jgi:anti-repressor protein
MNELIKVSYDNERQTVSGRGLHEFLEVGTEYRHWFPRMCEYGFAENIDYTPVIFDHPQNGQPTTDHQLTIEMAKELCMLQRTEKGKQARQYFIELEKQWNSPEAVFARALKMADAKILSLQSSVTVLEGQVLELKPKSDYYDDMAERNHLTNFRDTAKELKMKESDLIEVLEISGYIYRDLKGDIKPHAQYVPKLFEIKEFVARNGFAGSQTMITHAGREKFRVLAREGQLCLNR